MPYFCQIVNPITNLTKGTYYLNLESHYCIKTRARLLLQYTSIKKYKISSFQCVFAMPIWQLLLTSPGLCMVYLIKTNISVVTLIKELMKNYIFLLVTLMSIQLGAMSPDSASKERIRPKPTNQMEYLEIIEDIQNKDWLSAMHSLESFLKDGNSLEVFDDEVLEQMQRNKELWQMAQQIQQANLQQKSANQDILYN